MARRNTPMLRCNIDQDSEQKRRKLRLCGQVQPFRQRRSANTQAAPAGALTDHPTTALSLRLLLATPGNQTACSMQALRA